MLEISLKHERVAGVSIFRRGGEDIRQVYCQLYKDADVGKAAPISAKERKDR